MTKASPGSGLVGHLSPLERAKAAYRPMQSIDEILGLRRERIRLAEREPTP